MRDEMIDPAETSPGWAERLESVRKASGSLLATRVAIFREELSERTGHVARAAAGVAVALAFAIVALLVLTGLLAALFASWFGSAVLGLLAVFLLYVAIAGAAAGFGWKALKRAREGGFPVTREELARDWAALKIAKDGKKDGEEEAAEDDELLRDDRFSEETARMRDPGRPGADLETRFREESE